MRNHRKLSPPAWIAVFFFCSLLLHLAAFQFSRGFQHLDEHFQIIEYVSTKLGWTDPATLPWEYANRMRPWLQPFLYTGIAKVSIFFGANTPPEINQAIRLSTSLVGWISLAALFDLFRNLGPRLAFALSFFCFYPFFHTRTTAENLGVTTLVFGLWLLRQRHFFQGSTNLPGVLLSGVCFGLAFHLRYQLAFALLGLGTWMIVIERMRAKRITQLLCGTIIGIVLGVIIDHWGYGEWTFAPWNYFRVNLLEGAAAKFGVDPWWKYIEFLLRYPPVGGGWVVLATLLLFFFGWESTRRHVVTWILLPFIVGHFFVGHKEARFLYPIFVFYPVILIILESKLRGRISERLHLLLGVCLLLMNFTALLTYTFRREKPQFVLNEFISQNFRGTLHLAGLERDPFDWEEFYQHFYRPRDYHYYLLKGEGSSPQQSTAPRLRELFLQINSRNRNHDQVQPIYFSLHKKGFEEISSNPSPTDCKKIYELFPEFLLEIGLGAMMKKVNNTLVYRCEFNSQAQAPLHEN